MPHQTLLQKFLQAENERNWQTCSDCLHKEVTYEIVGQGVVASGKENYVRRMQKAYEEMDDWQFELTNTAESENGTIFVEFDGQGHFTGKFEGKNYQNVPLRLTSVCLFTFQDSKISKCKEYLDQDQGYPILDDFLYPAYHRNLPLTPSLLKREKPPTGFPWRPKIERVVLAAGVIYGQTVRRILL